MSHKRGNMLVMTIAYYEFIHKTGVLIKTKNNKYKLQTWEASLISRGPDVLYFVSKIGHLDPRFYSVIYWAIPGVQMSGVQMSGVQMSGVQMSGVQMSGVQMSGVQMSGVQMYPTQFFCVGTAEPNKEVMCDGTKKV